MYRVYAQDTHTRINLGIRRRLAPLLENDRRRIELMNALLFSLPGTPVIYYGDEIGMGDNFYLGDRNGVRTPMQWSGDRNAGFSRANPQKLYLPVIIDPEYHYEAINVETQQNNPHSLLWWMKRMLALRKQWKALGRGTLEFLYPENRRVLAFIRSHQEERILVIANLSRFAQATELDLSRYANTVPQELFGKSEFPAVTERPYFLSLGPHAFYWFALQPKESSPGTLRIRRGDPPTIAVQSWDEVFVNSARNALNNLVPLFLKARHWFRERNRTIRIAEITDVIPFFRSKSYLLLIRVEYSDGDPELYTVPVALLMGEPADARYVLARLQAPDGSTGHLYSAFQDRESSEEMLTAILRRRRVSGGDGELVASHTRALRRLLGTGHPSLEPCVSKSDQENTTVFFGDRLALKFLRKVEPGPYPEQEIGAVLTQAGFEHVPPLAGSLEYRSADNEPVTIAVLHGFVRDATEAWQYTLDHLGLFFERALASGPGGPPQDNIPQEAARDLIGSYLENVRLLGTRTGEMHVTLATASEDPAFAPEPFTDFYRHGLYHGTLSRCGRVIETLRGSLAHVPESVRQDADALLDREKAIRSKLQFLRDQRIDAMRIRVHGDYHLGQTLYTGKDFSIIDFEGDPSRPISERRIKRSPLEDVAGMVDSFYHASHAVLFGEAPGVIALPENLNTLEAWAKFWFHTVSRAFVRAYRETPGVAPLLPADTGHLRSLIIVFLLDRSFRKLAYELANAPERIRIPIHAILELAEQS